MKIFKRELKIKISILILIFLIIGLLSVSIFYFWNWNDSKSEAILASLIAGLFVALVQFLIQWNEFTASEKINHTGIIDILINRDNRDFYQKFISKSTSKIDMMGVTGSRFLEHFASVDPHAEERAKVLLDRLNNGVKVRILMPAPKFLDSTSKAKAKMIKNHYLQLKRDYVNFDIKYLDHEASHSIFKVDNECIVGPVFPEVSSKNTPAFHLNINSQIAIQYDRYFETEWSNAKEVN